MTRPFLDRPVQDGPPTVSLRRLLPEADFPALRDLMIAGCSDDGLRVEPGQVFVAVRGASRDGHDDVARALERGATAAVVERARPEAGRLQVVVRDCRDAYARITHALAGRPSDGLPIACVAGSAGAKAAATFLRSIFEADGRRTGSVDSSGWGDGVRRYPPPPSGLDAPGLARHLSLMIEQRCESAVLALEPEALASRAAGGLGLASLIVMGGAEAGGHRAGPEPVPRRDLSRLARQVNASGLLALNADDPEALLLGAANLAPRCVSFAIDGEADVMADVVAKGLDGTRLRLRGFGREAVVRLGPVGRSAMVAALGAAAVALAEGIGMEAVVAGLESVLRLPTGPQAIATAEGRPVFGLEVGPEAAVIQTLTELGALGQAPPLCVVSAGPETPAASASYSALERLASRVILTRMAGLRPDFEPWLGLFRDPARVRVLADRRRAIEAALDLTESGQCVVILGSSSQDGEIVAGWKQGREASRSRRSA